MDTVGTLQLVDSIACPISTNSCASALAYKLVFVYASGITMTASSGIGTAMISSTLHDFSFTYAGVILGLPNMIVKQVTVAWQIC